MYVFCYEQAGVKYDKNEYTNKSQNQVNTDYAKVEKVKFKSFRDLKPLKLIRKIWEK